MGVQNTPPSHSQSPRIYSSEHITIFIIVRSISHLRQCILSSSSQVLSCSLTGLVHGGMKRHRDALKSQKLTPGAQECKVG